MRVDLNGVFRVASEQLIKEYDRCDHSNGRQEKPFFFDETIQILKQRFHGRRVHSFAGLVQFLYL